MEKIEKVSLVHNVENQIENYIVSNNLLPGTKLPTEKVLCDTLDVSRGTVREAFRYLQAKGVVELQVGKGAFVAKTRKGENPEAVAWLIENEKDLKDATDLRYVIEPLAAKLAAENCSEEAVVELYHAFEKFVELASPENYKELAELDERFHHIIAMNCGNALLYEIIIKVEDGMTSFRETTFKIEQNIKDTIAPHENVLKAIMQRNPAKAEREMKKHIERVFENVNLDVKSSTDNS